MNCSCGLSWQASRRRGGIEKRSRVGQPVEPSVADGGFERLAQDDDFLTVKSDEFGITFEGRFNKETGEINGTLSQGPLEAPLLLRRTP